MPRYRNPTQGLVSLASGRVLEPGEQFTTATLDPEDQRTLDAGRLIEVHTPRKQTVKTQKEDG